ncbi:MAG: 1-deoxy-D-xylulose-5-phosphate synthase N-terminal domain-containing protein, partial [Steroidobacteraceae bacterium]
MSKRSYPLLSRIGTPADVRRLAPGELLGLCAELRGYLIESVSTRGGH